MNPATLLHIWLLFLTLVTISGCQSADLDYVSNHVELSLGTESIAIPLNELPELEEFLASAEPSNRQIEWERVQTSGFSSPAGVIYGDIRYNCGSKLCDHLWLQLKEGEHRTLALPANNGSIFVSHSFSPNETYLALLLGRNEGTELMRHQLLILRTDEFKAADVQGEPDVLGKQAVRSDFSFPILDLEWLDDQTLRAEVPDTTDLSYEGLQQWRQEGSKTRTLLLHMD